MWLTLCTMLGMTTMKNHPSGLKRWSGIFSTMCLKYFRHKIPKPQLLPTRWPFWWVPSGICPFKKIMSGLCHVKTTQSWIEWLDVVVCPHISSNVMVSIFVELQFAPLVGNKTLFFDVGILIILDKESITSSSMNVYL